MSSPAHHDQRWHPPPPLSDQGSQGLLDSNTNFPTIASGTAFPRISEGSIRRSYPIHELLETARQVSLDSELDHRVETCGLFVVPDRSAEIVAYENGSHGFRGLIRCGAGWVCPSCRARISSERGAEIQSAVVAAGRLGVDVSFVTFTMSHGVADTFENVRHDFSRAMSDLFSGASWSNFAKEIGHEGRIRVFEVTYSQTGGWHLHAHVLFFHRSSLDGFKLFRRWKSVLAKRGREASMDAFHCERVAVSDEDASRTAFYMTKVEALTDSTWSIGDEMAASYAKNGFRSETPEDLLRRAGEGDLDAIDLWVEYVKGTKGLNRIRWSKDLRKKLGLQDERSDEEIANDNDAQGDTVRRLSKFEVFALVKARMRVRVLRAADAEGLPGIERVIDEALAITYGRRRRLLVA